MTRNLKRSLSLLLLLATGCVYHPVCYDPVTGFQRGGGVDIACGGPLDPWMNHCGQTSCCEQTLCCLSELWRSLFCCSPCGWSPCCAPMCGPVCAPNLCAPPCPAPCAPVCPPSCAAPFAPVYQPGYPAPIGPYGGVSAPVPTFAPNCATCGPAPGQPHVTNYPHLFPPMAPPASPAYMDPYLMPTPTYHNEIQPTPAQLPPNSQNLETPAAPAPTNQAAPMNTQPMPMPMPTPAEATQMSYPQLLPPNVVPTSMPSVSPIPQSVMPPGAMMQDSRQQQFVPVRL